jgi:REP element-mobilizing transposase RayT
MSEKYKNKYRIPTARATWWDYNASGIYFVTICTAERQHYFGEIVQGVMRYSPIGAIAEVMLYELTRNRPYLEIGAYVIMPNHVHAMLIIHPSTDETSECITTPEEEIHAISQKMSAISPKAASLALVLRSYKAAVQKHANRLNIAFKWQTRFHDRIVRNEAAYYKIMQYIQDNPAKWDIPQGL